MKVINIQIRINDLSQTGVDWDDEDEVHMFLHHLRKDIKRVCVEERSIDKESVVINAGVANKIQSADSETCCSERITKEGESCSHEFVSREYSSQPYGTCLSCGKTIIF